MCIEIGSKYGPFDIAMLPIWRGGSLSFISRLGFRVRLSLSRARLLSLSRSSPSQQTLPGEKSPSNPLMSPPSQIVHARDSILTANHATPAHALRMHLALRSRHSLAMHFATFAGSDVEALDPIVELEQAKREIMIVPTGADRSGAVGSPADDMRRMMTTAVTVGDWWMEGGMGVIDVGETAIVLVGESEPIGA